MIERLLVAVVGLALLGYGAIGIKTGTIAAVDDDGGFQQLQGEDSHIYGWGIVVAGTLVVLYATWRIWRLWRHDEDWWS